MAFVTNMRYAGGVTDQRHCINFRPRGLELNQLGLQVYEWASFVFCKWPIEGYSCTIRLSFGMQPGHNHPCIGGRAEVQLFSTWGRGTIWGQEVQNLLQCPASAKLWLHLLLPHLLTSPSQFCKHKCDQVQQHFEVWRGRRFLQWMLYIHCY